MTSPLLLLPLPPSSPQRWHASPAATALAWSHRVADHSDVVLRPASRATGTCQAQGLFARRAFAKGELVLEEQPILTVATLSDDDDDDDGQKNLRLWRQWAVQLAAFAILSWSDRAAVLDLWSPDPMGTEAAALGLPGFLDCLQHCGGGGGSVSAVALGDEAVVAAARAVPRVVAARVLLIIRCNSFDWQGEGDEEVQQHVILPRSARINHSCAPNVIHQRSSDDGGTLHLSARRRRKQHMSAYDGSRPEEPNSSAVAAGAPAAAATTIQFFAVRDIGAGEELCHDYLGLVLMSTEARQQRLQETKYFLCQCAACRCAAAAPAAAAVAAAARAEEARARLYALELQLEREAARAAEATAATAAGAVAAAGQENPAVPGVATAAGSCDILADEIDWLWEFHSNARSGLTSGTQTSVESDNTDTAIAAATLTCSATTCIIISPVWYIGHRTIRSVARALAMQAQAQPGHQRQGQGQGQRRQRAVGLLKRVLAELPVGSAAYRDTSLELVDHLYRR